MTLQNVQDAPDGGYSIEQVTVPDLAFAGEEDKNDKAEIKGLAMQNVHIPSETAKGPLNSMVMYDKLKIDEIQFGTPGTDGATVKGFDLSLDTSNKAEKIGYVWTIANIDATFEKGGKNPLAPLDMNTFNGSLNSRAAGRRLRATHRWTSWNFRPRNSARSTSPAASVAMIWPSSKPSRRHRKT